MKRVAAAVLLLSAAVLISAGSGFAFRNEMNTLRLSLEELIDISETQSDELLTKKTEKLLSQWEKSSVILHSLVLHEGMDELEEDITALPMIIRHSDRDEFKIKCIEAINQIENLLNVEKINIENIL